MDKFAQYRELATGLGVDAVALVPGPNFEKLFRKAFHSHERPLLVVIPQIGPPAAIVPALELQSFTQIGFDGDVFEYTDAAGYKGAFDALAKQLPLTRIAVEGQVMRVFVHHALTQAYNRLKIVDGEAEISALRMIKDAQEIAALEEAISISENAMLEVWDRIAVGQTEKEIERHLVEALFRHGAEGMAFHPIVAAAENSALPHASARADYAIQPGDPLLFDWGARKGGLCADLTRTVFVGHARDDHAEVYQTVLAANQKGHERASAGVTAHQIDDAVTGVLEASPFADRIVHKTGHGLGRAVHEGPYIMRGNHQMMAAGMVFTNEPGLYRVGDMGVRIEDDILITEGGCRSLSTLTRDLTLI